MPPSVARSRPACRLSVLALAAWAGACSRTALDLGPPREEPLPALSSESFQQHYERAICIARVRCRVLPARDACTPLAIHGDARTTLRRPLATFASLRAGLVLFDPAAAQACLDALAAQPCNVLGAPLELDDVCRDAFTGLLEAGARCVSSAACAAGLSCQGSGCDATCTALPGGQCRRHVDCAAGLGCDAGRCVEHTPPGAAGEACGTPVACLDGLVCLREAGRGGATTRRCVAPPGLDEPCNFLQACAGPDLACMAAQGGGYACQPVRAAGERCAQWFECGTPFDGLACDADAGRCAERPATGPCLRTSAGSACDPARAFCDEGVSPPTCRARLPEGSACSRDLECERPWVLRCRAGDDGVDRCLPAQPGEFCEP